MLSSTRNPRVVAAAALRDRRARDEAGLTLIDGARELARAVAGGATVVEVYVDRERLRDDGVAALEAAVEAGAQAVDCAPFVIDRLAYGDRNDGLVGVARIPDASLTSLTLPADPLVVVVEGVEKPGNLGAVLRSADGAGADAVIAADPRTDLFNPNAVRASQGTVFARPGRGGPVDGGARLAARPGVSPWSRHGSMPRSPTRTRTSAARWRSCSAARRPDSPTPGRATTSSRSGSRWAASPTA